MSEERGIPRPGRLDRAETKRLLWHHKLPPGVSVQDATRAEYWHLCAGQLAQGHKIEVASADYRIWFEAYVVEANCFSNPPRVDLVFRAICPPNLDLPLRAIAPSRWITRQDETGGIWLVLDAISGERIGSPHMTRRLAAETVALLEKQAAEANTQEAA